MGAWTVLPLNVRRSLVSLASRMSAPLALLRQPMESLDCSRTTPLAADVVLLAIKALAAKLAATRTSAGRLPFTAPLLLRVTSAPLAAFLQATKSPVASRKTPLAAGFEESVTTELARTLENFSPLDPAPTGVSVLVPPVEFARVKVVEVPSYS